MYLFCGIAAWFTGFITLFGVISSLVFLYCHLTYRDPEKWGLGGGGEGYVGGTLIWSLFFGLSLWGATSYGGAEETIEVKPSVRQEIKLPVKEGETPITLNLNIVIEE